VSAQREGPGTLLRELDALDPTVAEFDRLLLDAARRPRLLATGASRGRPGGTAAAGAAPRAAPRFWLRIWRRVLSLVLRRFRPREVSEWLVRRFVPWIREYEARGSAAADAFWAALDEEHEQKLRAFLADARSDPRKAVTTRSIEDLLEISVFVRRGLHAAQDAWAV
jgi:hypothetical protein